jgi:hypothetical protein
MHDSSPANVCNFGIKDKHRQRRSRSTLIGHRPHFATRLYRSAVHHAFHDGRNVGAAWLKPYRASLSQIIPLAENAARQRLGVDILHFRRPKRRRSEHAG